MNLRPNSLLSGKFRSAEPPARVICAGWTLERRGTRPSWHCKETLSGCVDVADNDNKSRASPVHHRDAIWRLSTESPVETNPPG